MLDRPEPLERLDRYFAAARIAHEYADDLHHELAGLHAADVHTRKLLSDSADVIFREMPGLARGLRSLEGEWKNRSYWILTGQSALLNPLELVGPTWRRSAQRFVPGRMRSSPSWQNFADELAAVDGSQATRRSAAVCS